DILKEQLLGAGCARSMPEGDFAFFLHGSRWKNDFSSGAKLRRLDRSWKGHVGDSPCPLRLAFDPWNGKCLCEFLNRPANPLTERLILWRLQDFEDPPGDPLHLLLLHAARRECR